MPLDPRLLQYGVQSIFFGRSGPATLHVSVSYQGIANQPMQQIAAGSFHVENAQACFALADALRKIAEQMPPDLALADAGKMQ